MNFFRFVFSFLYVRNWHTGQLELSRPRVALFVSGIILLILGLLIINFLQTPVTYERL
jgi:hypothetical protein